MISPVRPSIPEAKTFGNYVIEGIIIILISDEGEHVTFGFQHPDWYL